MRRADHPADGPPFPLLEDSVPFSGSLAQICKAETASARTPLRGKSNQTSRLPRDERRLLFPLRK